MLRIILYSLRRLLPIGLLLWWAGPLHAQGLPASPVPVSQSTAPSPLPPTLQPEQLPPPGGASLPPPTPGMVAPPYVAPPYVAPPYVPYPGDNGPLFVHDRLLDKPCAPPGWFASLELDIVAPHIKNCIETQLHIQGFEPNFVHLPSELEVAGSPRFELGYRFCEGGEFLASYRLLDTEGTRTLFGWDLDGSDGVLKSRLSMNVLDLDYGSREYCLDPHWDVKWRLGARLADVFFDSRAEAFFLEQRTSNSFIGAGPHALVDFWRSFNCPGFGLFTRLESAVLIGRVSQSSEEAVADEEGNLFGTGARITRTRAVPILGVEAGLAWTSCWRHHWSRLSLGYKFEEWWSIGDAGASRADLMYQGVFFRSEFAF